MEETIYHQLVDKITSRWSGLDFSMVVAEVSVLSQEEVQLSLDWFNNPLSKDTEVPFFISKYLVNASVVSLLRSNIGYGCF